jgi:hypothetical protein
VPIFTLEPQRREAIEYDLLAEEVLARARQPKPTQFSSQRSDT